MLRERVAAKMTALGLGTQVDEFLSKAAPVVVELVLDWLLEMSRAKSLLPGSSGSTGTPGLDLGSLLVGVLQRAGTQLLAGLAASLQQRGDPLSMILATLVQGAAPELLDLLSQLLTAAPTTAALDQALMVDAQIGTSTPSA